MTLGNMREVGRLPTATKPRRTMTRCGAQEAFGELSSTSAFLASSLDASDNR
jgi:hypothetical protein